MVGNDSLTKDITRRLGSQDEEKNNDIETYKEVTWGYQSTITVIV